MRRDAGYLGRGLVAALALAAGHSGGFAQDSVSATPGLPGDSVSAYAAGAGSEQINNYVVDLPLRTTSWGARYHLGAVIKSSASSSSAYYNHLIASTVASPVMTGFVGQSAVRTSYALWTSPGQGVNATRNGAGTPVSTAGIPMATFAVGFLEFAGGANATFGDSDDENNIIVGLVSFAPQYPGRVYVSRVMAGSNKTATAPANASLGLGMVDPLGHAAILADGVGLTGPNPVSNKKLIRVNARDRVLATLNSLSESGGADSTNTRIVGSSLTTQTAPTLVPSTLAGRPVVMNLDMANVLNHELAANAVTASTAHLGAGVSARGAATFSPGVFASLGAGARVGTGLALSRAPSTSKTRSVSAWSVSPLGQPSGTLKVDLPTGVGSLVDLDDGFDPSAAFGSLENQEFVNFASQVPFRGPAGPVAGAVLPGGDLLLAATMAHTGAGGAVPASVHNAIAVARVNAADSTVVWTLAAHTGGAQGAAGGQSKSVYGDNGPDGVPGTGDLGEGDGLVDSTPIGQLALATEAVPGGSVSGPSLSAPAMDALGNIYFMGHVRLLAPGAPGARFTTALLKANLNRATNRYRLELISEVGDVVAGLNSGRNYQVQFMSVADADSVDSGTLWPSSIVQQTLPGIDAAAVPYGSPLSLGALVFRAKIVYDTNSNGQFVDPTVPGQTGTDEAYNVAMLLMPRRAAADIGSQGGVTPSDGLYDNNDFVVFIDAFFAGNAALADLGGQGGVATPDGVLDNNDFIVFIDAFFNQQ